MSKKGKEKLNDFLLTYFDNSNKQEAKEINGFILFKKWDGFNKKFVVNVFTKSSFENWEAFRNIQLF